MADQRRDDREGIAKEKGGVGGGVGRRQQHEQRRAGRSQIERGDERHRRTCLQVRDRGAPPADVERGQPEMAEQQRDEAQGGDDHPAEMQPVQRQADVENRQQLRTRHGRQTREQDDAVPEAQARERDHAPDLPPAEPRGAIDAVARRAAGQEGQAQIVAKRVACEGGKGGRAPRQFAADDAQRAGVV